MLEGEGLANDATALILYRFAVAAVGTGPFSLGQAAGTFALIVVGEIGYGIGMGWLSLRLRRWARDPRVEITLSLMTPYLAFWVPEHLGGSGVLATVAAGLFVSWNGPLLISAATRLQGIFFWDLVIYLLEGILFLLTGLQARTLSSARTRSGRATRAGGADHDRGRGRGPVPVGVPGDLPAAPAQPVARPPRPGSALADRFVTAFVGIRGVVSLAAALAIPLATAAGAPFPHRDLILSITFGVILITLIGQGLLLPTVVRWLGLAHAGADERREEHEAELAARSDALCAGRSRLTGSRPSARSRPGCWRGCRPATHIGPRGCGTARITIPRPPPSRPRSGRS